MNIISVRRSTDLDASDAMLGEPHIIASGAVTEIAVNDLIAGWLVTAVADSEHAHRPAVRITLGAGPVADAGRLVVRRDLHDFDAIEFTRAFDSDADLDAFVAASREPAGFRPLLARQLQRGDRIMVGVGSTIIDDREAARRRAASGDFHTAEIVNADLVVRPAASGAGAVMEMTAEIDGVGRDIELPHDARVYAAR